MKLGFVLPNNWGLDDPSAVVALGVAAEERGLHSVWVNHHVVNVGYIADRLQDRPYYDALTTLAWVGAGTERIGLGTSVLVLPYLHPMVLAKELATLDQLSGGRVIAGVGVGSLPEENEILGVGYEDRGARADAGIGVMRALWGQGPTDVDGAPPGLPGVVASPKPHQARLPIWVGGSGAPARRRAARFGEGWHPMCSREGLARRMPEMVEALARNDRLRSDLVVAPRIVVDQVPDRAAVEAWAMAGADQLIIGTATDDLDAIARSLDHVAGLID